ncbi:hypothetical protein B0H13DRAFT_2345498 [Mycena leptocephala]|nr:hypothetical protein B0H13DRAFT_2345498 [Mycena leptocephala]
MWIQGAGLQAAEYDEPGFQSSVKYEQDPWPATGLRIDGSAFKLEARSRSSRERRGFRRGEHTSIVTARASTSASVPHASLGPPPASHPPLAPIDAAVTRDCATSVRIQAHHAPLTRSSIAHKVAVSISIYPWSVPPPASLHSAAQTPPATLAVLGAAAHAKAHGTIDLLSHPAYTSASSKATGGCGWVWIRCTTMQLLLQAGSWGGEDREPKETGTTTSMSANTSLPIRTVTFSPYPTPRQLRATSGKLGRMERERKEVESNLGARMNTDPTTSTSQGRVAIKGNGTENNEGRRTSYPGASARYEPDAGAGGQEGGCREGNDVDFRADRARTRAPDPRSPAHEARGARRVVGVYDEDEVPGRSMSFHGDGGSLHNRPAHEICPDLYVAG